MTNTQLEELLADEPQDVQDEIIRINTDARPRALQVALLVPAARRPGRAGHVVPHAPAPRAEAVDRGGGDDMGMTTEAGQGPPATALIDPPGRVHRRRRHGGRRHLRPARLGRRGRRRGRVDLVPDRRRGRRAPGLLVRQVRRPLPVRGRAAGVRGPRVRERAHHRRHRLADPGRQRHRDRDGGGVVRQLRQHGVRRRRGRLGARVRRARGGGDDAAQRPGVPGGRPGPDRGRHRRAGHPHRCSPSRRWRTSTSTCWPSPGTRRCGTSCRAWR